jgi:type IV pilus assembly protein PilC
MVYPIVVILVAVSILSFILIYIIPKFEKIFKDFDMKLPAITQLLLDISAFVRENWYVFPIIVFGIWLFIKLICLFKRGRYVWDWIKLHIPIVGGIIEKTIIARTTRTLGTLVSSGVPILEALSIVKETCNNAVYEGMYQNVYESIREGETIAAPLKESRLVDDMVVNMVDVGEETGELDKMLYKVAEVYEEEVDVLVESLISILEPLMVVFLGVCVGFIVVALFMPMLAILEKLGGRAG